MTQPESQPQMERDEMPVNSKQEAAAQQLISELQHAEQALLNTEEEWASELFRTAHAALASANARLEAVRPYIQHKSDCYINQGSPYPHKPRTRCDCGLAAVLGVVTEADYDCVRSANMCVCEVN